MSECRLYVECLSQFDDVRPFVRLYILSECRTFRLEHFQVFHQKKLNRTPIATLAITAAAAAATMALIAMKC